LPFFVSYSILNEKQGQEGGGSYGKNGNANDDVYVHGRNDVQDEVYEDDDGHDDGSQHDRWHGHENNDDENARMRRNDDDDDERNGTSIDVSCNAESDHPTLVIAIIRQSSLLHAIIFQTLNYISLAEQTTA
jgi:hypothetical protein